VAASLPGRGQWSGSGGVASLLARGRMFAVEWGETGKIFGKFFLFLSGEMGEIYCLGGMGEIYCFNLGYYQVKPSLFCILK
jgi:hypothetical protein